MYLDAFTVSALVDELLDTVAGGRIQDVIDVDPTGIGLEIYANRQRHYLYMSADKQVPRVHLVPDKLRRGVQQHTQMGLLLRRYVEGAILSHVSQPAWERILQFDVEGPEGEFTLVIEPMERRSNILLLRDGTIIDCMWRVGPDENRYRLSLPRHEYQLPPPLTGRIDPSSFDKSQIEALFEGQEDKRQKAVRVLASGVLGVSPLLARELVYRASGSVDVRVQQVDTQRLTSALHEIMPGLLHRDWQPGVVRNNDETLAYSVYPITHLPDWEAVETVSEAMSAYYGAAVGPDAYNEAKKPVFQAIEEGRAKNRAKLASMERGLKDDSEREALQQSGELILAYQYTIEPGQTELRAQYNPDDPELVITLDPSLTPLENAQRYFDRYNRAKRAQAGVPQLIEDVRVELAYLDQLENDLQNAANWPEIDDVIQALQSRGIMGKERTLKRMGGGGRTGPLKLVKDGYVIWVGRNSRQNEQVTFKNANSQDLWLHARDVPGAHVVIRNDGRRIPESLIDAAAAVAAYYSSRRTDTSVIVDVTRVKYVRKIKGAGPGMVTYRNEETVTVQPQNEEILKDG